MQCRNCKQFEDCGHIRKIIRDMNMQDFLKMVKNGETCLDFEVRKFTLSENELRGIKQGISNIACG